MAENPSKIHNHLIGETSPYLLQHVDNPVDWYPWGTEALQKALQEDKPILVSIGYAACHWCHVMAHESFEDPAVAAVQNEHFVNIKVDREERPDVDSIYMTAVQAMSGQGGWPLNVFLLPDGTPFYGGTYFPPDEKAARYNMPSWRQVLLSVAAAYRDRRSELIANGRELLSHISKLAQVGAGTTLPALVQLLTTAYEGVAQNFDERNGGFGDAPKFPQPMTLEFVLRAQLRGESQALAMLEFTLHKMAHGGIYDQLGGGFHRYSVDAVWLVPHFEKMLYDNALLARLYAETFQVTQEPFYQRIAEETLDYLLREMRHPQGGFFSTQDADSLVPGTNHKHEGEFFVWTPEELTSALGEDAPLFAAIYDVSRRGNFEGRNILHLPRPLGEVARATGASVERLEAVAARGRQILFALRETRPKPERDEKILTAWNGMALRAFVSAAAAFQRNDYLQAARDCADFLLRELRRSDGRLLRSWRDGRASIPAFLEDYALFADGLLALYSVDGDERWLRASIATADAMIDLFWDEGLGGFYDTGSDAEQLVTRPRDVSDNATPSGNSVAAELLLRLSALTGNESYRERALNVIAGQSDMLGRFPLGFGRMLCAVDLAAARVKEVAIIGEANADDTLALRDALVCPYRPHVVVAYGTPGGSSTLTPLLAGRGLLDGTATAYVCENFACRLPVNTVEKLEEELKM